MRRSKIFLILICFTGLFVDSSQAQSSQTKKSKILTKPKQVDKRGCLLGSYSTVGNKVVTAHYNCQPTIKTLALSQTEVYTQCSTKEKGCSNKEQNISVVVEATDPEYDVLSYRYTVSNGKIIGQNAKDIWTQDAKVTWDLSGVTLGTYTITVEVDDGFGIRAATITKEVKVVECPNCNSKVNTKHKGIHEETAQIKNLTLSQTDVYSTCLNSEQICSRDKAIIEISVEAQNDENDVLSYNYEIKDGKIIGKGEKVIWDLSGVRIGTYTIKASVDDGAGVTRAITKEIKVIECPNCN